MTNWWITAALISFPAFLCATLSTGRSVLTDNVSCSFLKKGKRALKVKVGSQATVKKKKTRDSWASCETSCAWTQWQDNIEKKKKKHNLKLPTPRHWTPLTVCAVHSTADVLPLSSSERGFVRESRCDLCGGLGAWERGRHYSALLGLAYCTHRPRDRRGPL